ncbi:MAG: hypothetical protein LBS90_02045 [Oscillospiraceae bacterium]|jgi:hypothetical protein|nr:hypothetical protein [Oscillospiraceae bacterium]
MTSIKKLLSVCLLLALTVMAACVPGLDATPAPSPPPSETVLPADSPAGAARTSQLPAATSLPGISYTAKLFSEQYPLENTMLFAEAQYPFTGIAEIDRYYEEQLAAFRDRAAKLKTQYAAAESDCSVTDRYTEIRNDGEYFIVERQISVWKDGDDLSVEYVCDNFSVFDGHRLTLDGVFDAERARYTARLLELFDAHIKVKGGAMFYADAHDSLKKMLDGKLLDNVFFMGTGDGEFIQFVVCSGVITTERYIIPVEKSAVSDLLSPAYG